ncbi:uncharacterized protein M6B38_256540 [Iris pallida]|uniref:SKP1-like protein n=1 Tax=Iris pallida TaxID=29817 RepID=A0AAX6IFJ1_IRIPA|nr:uncharacterized protein M6B38_256540 [Iris pallida]
MAIRKEKLVLKSSDGEEFVVDVATASMSTTIKNMVDDGCADSAIPLPNVTGGVLAKVIEYCNKHAEAKAEFCTGFDDNSSNDKLKTWDANFMKVDQNTLFDIMLAANYLSIKGLVDLTCKTVADMMLGKTPDEIRNTFHIVNDYTPEEEAEVRRENAWAFD